MLNLDIHLKYFTIVLTFINRLLLTLLWVSRPDVPLIISCLQRLSGNNCLVSCFVTGQKINASTIPPTSDF